MLRIFAAPHLYVMANNLPKGTRMKHNMSKPRFVSTRSMIWPTRPASTPAQARGAVSKEALFALVKFIATLATIAGVVVSAFQLVQMNGASKIDRANSAVQQFLTSKDTRELSDIIASKTKQGTDYTSIQTDPSVKQSVQYYLNGLEMIAGAGNKGYYDESVVFMHLAQTIYKQARAHLLGQSGRTPAGDWKTNQALFSNNEYPELRRLYKKWFPEDMYRESLP